MANIDCRGCEYFLVKTKSVVEDGEVKLDFKFYCKLKDKKECKKNKKGICS